MRNWKGSVSAASASRTASRSTTSTRFVLLGMRVLFADEEQSAMVRNGRGIDPSRSRMYEFCGSRPDNGCSCMPAFVESHAPLEDGELVAVVSSNRLSAVYRYDPARRMLVADCVFQVEVSRGADI